MDLQTTLITVLEEEVRIGESLLHNLFAQRNAVVAWNASELLERISERELLIYRLADLAEYHKQLLMPLLDFSPQQEPVLTALLVRLPAGPERDTLRTLQERATNVFARVQIEERRLSAILENLLGHLHTLLSPLAHTPIHLYSRGGTASPSRSTSGLIQGKA